MKSERSYRLGNYRITLYDDVFAHWERHVPLAMARSGKCYLYEEVLIMGSKYDDEDGFQSGEFLDRLRELPPWTRTRYYCFESDLLDSATGHALAGEALERFSSFAGMNQAVPTRVEVAHPGAYRIGNYQIAYTADGRLQWKAHEELDRIASGQCSVESGILIIGPREQAEQGAGKQEFVSALNRLPQWDRTMIWCLGNVLRQCREERQKEKIGLFRWLRKLRKDDTSDVKEHRPFKESRESKRETRPMAEHAGRSGEAARRLLLSGSTAMNKARQLLSDRKSLWRWLVLIMAALAAAGLAGALYIAEKGFSWGHGVKKHHHEHHAHDR